MRNYQRTTDTNKYGKCGHIPRNPAFWLLYINKVMLCCRPGLAPDLTVALTLAIESIAGVSLVADTLVADWSLRDTRTLQVTPENTWRQRDTCRLPHCSSSCLANAKHCVRTFLFFTVTSTNEFIFSSALVS